MEANETTSKINTTPATTTTTTAIVLQRPCRRAVDASLHPSRMHPPLPSHSCRGSCPRHHHLRRRRRPPPPPPEAASSICWLQGTNGGGRIILGNVGGDSGICSSNHRHHHTTSVFEKVEEPGMTMLRRLPPRSMSNEDVARLPDQGTEPLPGTKRRRRTPRQPRQPRRILRPWPFADSPGARKGTSTNVGLQSVRHRGTNRVPVR